MAQPCVLATPTATRKASPHDIRDEQGRVSAAKKFLADAAQTLHHGKEALLARRLKERQNIPKNASPFLPADFLPLLPPPGPEDKLKISLAIDLDETLVYAQSFPRSVGVPSGLKYDELVEDGDQLIVVQLRPYLFEFLEFVSERFEAILFTAGLSSYADPLLARVDPEGRLLRRHLRLYRRHCADMGGKKVKDLGLLGRSLERIALLDNTPSAYAFQPRNGIPIVSWYGDKNDTALLDMMPLLEKLSRASDVYEVLDHHAAVSLATTGVF